MTVPTIYPHSSPHLHHRSSSGAPTSIAEFLESDSRDMAEHHSSSPSLTRPASDSSLQPPLNANSMSTDGDSVITPSSPPTPGKLSRSGSFSDLDDEAPLDKLTVFDLLENLALPARFNKLQTSITRSANRGQERFRTSSQLAREKVVDEWRKRLPTAEEQLDKYRKRMRSSVDRLNRIWKNDISSVTLWEKTSFIAGVLNIFITGYLVGAHPEWFHYWYTLQLFYFMPVRVYTYKKKGYHYFLADLCYFVNGLTLLSIYVFPQSKRLLISAFCLAFGNNAIAIAMWRNSLVFHSMDKVVSLFIHIMPPLALHCIIHLIPKELQKQRFPAVHTILYSSAGDPEHYTLTQMMLWASLPYAIWQLSYHTLISVRRADKIAAGRPTSFTWLRRSFANVWIGKIVLSLPTTFQEPAYMAIQYVYALLTMVPCPLWMWSGWASGIFLSLVFAWSVWNGATYYIDVFGRRFQKELEALKKDVARLNAQHATGLNGGQLSPLLSPALELATPGLSADGRDALPGIDGGLGTDTVMVEPEAEPKKDK